MKIFLFLRYLAVVIFPITAFGQSWQWAFSTSMAPRSHVVAVKQDQADNFYVASFTDSSGSHISTNIQKRNSGQQVMWQKQITGDAATTDLEINAFNHAMVVGYFKGTITIDGNTLTSFSPADNSVFIFETDENGTLQWVHTLNPVNGEFRSGDLFLARNGSMYLTSQVSGSFGFCAFHQLDVQGNVVKNEFNNNFENRTFSHVLADSSGNVYLSGTCGNFATFDTINVNPNFSYQNFLVKYDSAFQAQWLISRNYITFDDNNSLSSDGQYLHWSFDDFTSGQDTVKMLVYDYNGQLLNTVNGPLPVAFFPSIECATDSFGNSVLIQNVYTRIYVYRYDALFNLTWQDTLLTSTSGFPFYNGLSCCDSSFYLASYYLNDSLQFDTTLLLNPNAAANFPSDIFVAKWGYQIPTDVHANKSGKNTVAVYPNPVSGEMQVHCSEFNTGDLLTITDVLGHEVYLETMFNAQIKVRVSNLAKGIYFLQLINKEHVVHGSAKFIVM